jgi:putative DNA primase/helicase
MFLNKRKPLLFLKNQSDLMEEKNNNKREINDIIEKTNRFILLEQKGKATELITEYIKNNYFIYTTIDDKSSECWIYKNGIYIPNGKFYIQSVIREMAKHLYTIRWADAIYEKIKIDTKIEKDKFFSNNYKFEIPVQNGVLNIKTKELKPFNPTKIFFNKMPITYNPKAQCPIIDKFLNDIMKDENDKNVFYEIGGFCLLKEYTYEKAFMFLGSGRNGKSKCLELLKRTIGAENCFSLPLNALNSNNADLSQLFGKMVNLAGDIGYEDLKDTSTFKSLTGRDLITSKRKFLTALTFENFAKFIFSCNQLPKVYDTSKAFWDRWILIEFPYYFATKEELVSKEETDKSKWKLRDEEIINKITDPNELSGLLNAFLEGYERLKRNNRFSTTKGTNEVKNTWIRIADSFYTFCEEYITISNDDINDRVPKKELRKTYKDYCTKLSLKMSQDKYIHEFLEKNYFVTTKQDANYEYLWTGIKLKGYTYSTLKNKDS